jgi:hypothetical protein
MSEPTPKRSGQRDKILTWLRMRGPQGVLNTELTELCMRYGARIFELRKAGYDIKTVKLDDSRFRFVLEEEPHHISVVFLNSRTGEITPPSPDFSKAKQQSLFAATK